MDKVVDSGSTDAGSIPARGARKKDHKYVVLFYVRGVRKC